MTSERPFGYRTSEIAERAFEVAFKQKTMNFCMEQLYFLVQSSLMNISLFFLDIQQIAQAKLP